MKIKLWSMESKPSIPATLQFFFFLCQALNETDLQALGWNRSKVRGVEKTSQTRDP